MDEQNKIIGYITGGGLEANLQARLTIAAQEVQAGAFVVMDSGNWRFYSLVTDLQLCAVNEKYAQQLSLLRYHPALASMLNEQTLYTQLAIMPALMLDRGPEPGSPEYLEWRASGIKDERPMPVKTVPKHHTPVRLATEEDINNIFGVEDNKKIFRVGNTREQGHPVCLNLEKFVQRSSGIFGTTGSGKSFLARMILAGLIHANSASTLIFDMHNEYGPDSSSSDTGASVSGLKSKFGNKVQLVGLGKGTCFGNMQADFNLEISYGDITSEDILQLSQTLNLRETSAGTLNALYDSFNKKWFKEFMAMRVGGVEEDPETGKKTPSSDSVAFWAEEVGINVMAAESLHGKLKRLHGRPYLVENPDKKALRDITDKLMNGQHVVLSFGDFDSELDYLLVTNLITRKIRETWENATNEYHKDKKKEPRPLVVVVEEAHKLLNREMASQTIFSTIAREMRKYYVTLLIIDQRPSQIYDEVMSQLGTRISGSLGDEDDINAVLSGLSGRSALRGMLAKLQPKEEALLLGWGVPMPIPIRSRRYDQVFWEEVLGGDATPMDPQRAIASLYGESDPDE